MEGFCCAIHVVVAIAHLQSRGTFNHSVSECWKAALGIVDGIGAVQHVAGHGAALEYVWLAIVFSQSKALRTLPTTLPSMD